MDFEKIIEMLQEYTYVCSCNERTKAKTIVVKADLGMLEYKFNSTYDGTLRFVGATYKNNSFDNEVASKLRMTLGGFNKEISVHYGSKLANGKRQLTAPEEYVGVKSMDSDTEAETSFSKIIFGI